MSDLYCMECGRSSDLEHKINTDGTILEDLYDANGDISEEYKKGAHAAIIAALKYLGYQPVPEKCSPKCASNTHSFDDDPRCDCGREELLFHWEKWEDFKKSVDYKEEPVIF